MTDNLARFERMAQRAAERREVQEESERRAAAELWNQEYGPPAEARSHESPGFLAGPPDGCRTCYAWQRHVMGGWYWMHQAAVDPVTKPFRLGDDDPEPPFPCEFCMHHCHGPGGLPLPVIAYG